MTCHGLPDFGFWVRIHSTDGSQAVRLLGMQLNAILFWVCWPHCPVGRLLGQCSLVFVAEGLRSIGTIAVKVGGPACEGWQPLI